MQLRLAEFCLKMQPSLGEFPRRGALEREDRLFLVADREDGAHHAVARARACGELGDDVIDDVPLPRARILRLVDQHMIDAAVELVMHPAGGSAVQQGQRLVDQIVVIEQAALQLLAAIILHCGGCDMDKGFGAVARRDRTTLFDQGVESTDLRIEQSARRGIPGDEAVRYHRCPRRFCICEKYPKILVHLRGVGESQRLAKPICLPLVGIGARSERTHNLFPA